MKIAAALPPPRAVSEADATAHEQSVNASDFEQALTSTFEHNSSHPAPVKAPRSKEDPSDKDSADGTPQSTPLTMPAPVVPAPVMPPTIGAPDAQDSMTLAPVTADEGMPTTIPSDLLIAADGALSPALTASSGTDLATTGEMLPAQAPTSPAAAQDAAQVGLLEPVATAQVESPASAAATATATATPVIPLPERRSPASSRAANDATHERISVTRLLAEHATAPEGPQESGFEVTLPPEAASAQELVLAESSHPSASMVAKSQESEPLTLDSSDVTTGAPAVAASPSSPLTPGPLPTSLASAPPAPVAQQLMARLTPLRLGEDGSHETTLLLHPRDLGPVRIKVNVMNQSVSLHLTGTGGQACELLRQALPDLGRELGATGLTLSFADVQEQPFTSAPGQEQFTDSGTAHQDARQAPSTPAPAAVAATPTIAESVHLRQHLGVVDVMA